MFGSILILTFSVLMFLYWFRYTSLLVLQTKTEERFAGRIAAANRLSFPQVQASLKGNGESSLDSLYDSLRKDYEILCYLLRHASGFGGHTLEQKVLLIDYAAMSLWYRVVRASSESQARRALDEMARVLAYFAGAMGQRAEAIY